MKARLVGVTLAICALSALSGCTNTSQVDTAPRTVTLDDGTSVMCVLAIDKANGGSASPSCNWERYNQLHPAHAELGPR